MPGVGSGVSACLPSLDAEEVDPAASSMWTTVSATSSAEGESDLKRMACFSDIGKGGDTSADIGGSAMMGGNNNGVTMIENLYIHSEQDSVPYAHDILQR